MSLAHRLCPRSEFATIFAQVARHRLKTYYHCKETMREEGAFAPNEASRLLPGQGNGALRFTGASGSRSRSLSRPFNRNPITTSDEGAMMSPQNRHPSSGAHASSALLGPAAGASTPPHALAPVLLERVAPPSPVSDTTSVDPSFSDSTSMSWERDSSDGESNLRVESNLDVEQDIFLSFENKWERSDLGKNEVSLFKKERTVRRGNQVVWQGYDKKDLILNLMAHRFEKTGKGRRLVLDRRYIFTAKDSSTRYGCRRFFFCPETKSTDFFVTLDNRFCSSHVPKIVVNKKPSINDYVSAFFSYYLNSWKASSSNKLRYVFESTRQVTFEWTPGKTKAKSWVGRIKRDLIRTIRANSLSPNTQTLIFVDDKGNRIDFGRFLFDDTVKEGKFTVRTDQSEASRSATQLEIVAHNKGERSIVQQALAIIQMYHLPKPDPPHAEFRSQREAELQKRYSKVAA